MNPEHKETLLQTIKARLERSEKGTIQFFPDSNGQWNIVEPPNSGLVAYFISSYPTKYDDYGQPI